jgi:hypothetical protein
VRLRESRDAEAASLEVSRFVVASNALLAAMARANPASLSALDSVPGMDSERLEKFGTVFLQALHGELADPAPSSADPAPIEPVPAEPVRAAQPKGRGRPVASDKPAGRRRASARKGDSAVSASRLEPAPAAPPSPAVEAAAPAVVLQPAVAPEVTAKAARAKKKPVSRRRKAVTSE